MIDRLLLCEQGICCLCLSRKEGNLRGVLGGGKGGGGLGGGGEGGGGLGGGGEGGGGLGGGGSEIRQQLIYVQNWPLGIET